MADPSSGRAVNMWQGRSGKIVGANTRTSPGKVVHYNPMVALGIARRHDVLDSLEPSEGEDINAVRVVGWTDVEKLAHGDL